MLTLAERESERLREQTRLDADRDQAARNRAGQFATPPALAADVLAAVLPHLPPGEPVRFLEPSVGGGAFVSALLARPPAARIERMLGLESDPRFANLAARLWGPAGLDVVAGDFTATPPAGRFNLLVANPPYVRHHHLDRETKRRLQAVTAAVGPVSGLAGLYVYFMLAADAWLAPGGVAAWLVPAEFLDVNYGQAVRRYLARSVDLLAVHRFTAADVQFGDALVSSAVVVFRKAPPTGGPVAFSSGGPVSRPDVTVSVGRDRLDPSVKWGHLFAAGVRPGVVGPRLGDLFTVRRGLATGGNEFFILPRGDATARGLPASCLRPILPSPRYLTGDVIEAGADGAPRLPRDLVLLDCRLTEREVREHPSLAAYLAEGARTGVADGYLCSHRTPWYAQENRPPAPFVVPYMGRGRGGASPFRFVRNCSRATAPNVYLMLYPRGALAQRLAADPDRVAAVHAALQALGETAIEDGGRVYGGGLRKVEPAELAALPAGGVLEAAGGHHGGLFDGLPHSA